MHVAVPILFYFAVAIVSFYYYEINSGQPAADRSKHPTSLPSFAVVHRLLAAATLGLAIASVISDAAILLSVYETPVSRYVGIAISALGLALFVAAKLDLGEHFSPCTDMYIPKDIVRDGVYRWIRHPIYTANALISFGVLISTGSLWIVGALAIMLAYYAKSVSLEEMTLEAEFPIAFAAYQRETGRFLPRLGGPAQYEARRLGAQGELDYYRSSYLAAGGPAAIPTTTLRASEVIGLFEGDRLIGGYCENTPPERSLTHVPAQERDAVIESCGVPSAGIREISCLWLHPEYRRGVAVYRLYLEIGRRFILSDSKVLLADTHYDGLHRIYSQLGLRVMRSSPSPINDGGAFRLYRLGKARAAVTLVGLWVAMLREQLRGAARASAH